MEGRIQNEKRRDYGLDFLKIIATTIILFHHFQQITGVSYTNHMDFFYGAFYFGYLVELFFIISGFVSVDYIERFMDGQPFHVFYLRKARRLLPLMALSVIVYEVLSYLYLRLYHTNWMGVPLNLFGSVIASLGIQTGWVFSNPMINNPIYYCSVLLLCYVVFFIITRIAMQWRILPVYGYLFMILIGCGVFTFNIDLPFLNSNAARGYYAFFSGLVLAMALKRIKIGKTLVAFCLALSSGILFLIVRKHPFVANDVNYIICFLVYPSIIILFQSPLAKRIFTHKIWGELSKISYNVYIWHVPLLMLIYITKSDIDFTKVTTMYCFALVAWTVGTFSHYVVEKPINRLIEKYIASHSSE